MKWAILGCTGANLCYCRYNIGSADKAMLKKLGKHVLSGSCLHIRKLSDVDLEVLRTLTTDSLAQMRTKYAN